MRVGPPRPSGAVGWGAFSDLVLKFAGKLCCGERLFPPLLHAHQQKIYCIRGTSRHITEPTLVRVLTTHGLTLLCSM